MLPSEELAHKFAAAGGAGAGKAGFKATKRPPFLLLLIVAVPFPVAPATALSANAAPTPSSGFEFEF